MRYAYYPGCSLEGLSAEYNRSVQRLFELLGVDFEEVPDWICCGTLAAPSVSRLLGLVNPLWNIARAKQANFDQIIAPCSACLYHFKHALKQVTEDPGLCAEVEAILEQSLTGAPPTIHPLQILSDEIYEERICGLLQRDLSELKVVCYYGCHISRPADLMQFDDPEHPQSMDRVLRWAGVQVLDWSKKVDCCGAHLSLVRPEIVVNLCMQLFKAAAAAGADAVVVACPMCHVNLETRQASVAEILGQPLNLPVLYFTQVLGYALGLEPQAVGLKKHLIDPIPLITMKCRQGAVLENPI